MVDTRRSRRLAGPAPEAAAMAVPGSTAAGPVEAQASHSASPSGTPAPTPAAAAHTSSSASPAPLTRHAAVTGGATIILPENPIPLFDFYLELGDNPHLDSSAGPLNPTHKVFVPNAHAEIDAALSCWKRLEAYFATGDAAGSPLQQADGVKTEVQAGVGDAPVTRASARDRSSSTEAKSSDKAGTTTSRKRRTAAEDPVPPQQPLDSAGEQEAKTLALEVELFPVKRYLYDLGIVRYPESDKLELVFQVQAHAPSSLVERLESQRQRLQKALDSSFDFNKWFQKGPEDANWKLEREILRDECPTSCALGYIVPSAIGDAGHPLCHLEENLVTREWVTLYGEVTLREPIFPPDEPIIGAGAPHPWGRARMEKDAYATWWVDPLTGARIAEESPHKRAPPSRLPGDMLIEVGLAPEALHYGADGHADGFIESVQDLPANVAPNALTLSRSLKHLLPRVVDYADGFLEVNTAVKSLWDDTKSFYRLPPARTSLSTCKKLLAKEQPSPKKSPSRGNNYKRRKADVGLVQRNNGRKRIADPSHTTTELVTCEELEAEADEDDEAFLPLDTNIASLLEMCRPPRDGAMRAPPSEVIPTPLLPYQARCLAWMVDRETALDDEAELTYPGWLALKTKPVERVNALRRQMALDWKRKQADWEYQRRLAKHRQQEHEREQKAKAEEGEEVKPDPEQSDQGGSSDRKGKRAPPKRAPAKVKGKGKAKVIAASNEPAPMAVTEADVVLKEPFTDPVDVELFFDESTGIVSLRHFTCRRREPGGVLCESMGLGKTLESLALVASNPCPSIQGLTPAHRSRSASLVAGLGRGELKPLVSRATLVVCPAALIEQWLDEIRKHFRSRQTGTAPVPGQPGTTQPGVVRFSDDMFRWGRSDSRTAVRDWASANLVEPDIVVASYEDLASQLSLSQKTTDNGSGPRSPLLEVLWWRVMLDEAQIVAASPSKATAMVHELWRVNCWMVTGTPVAKGIKDLHGIFGFLDHDPLASPHKFKDLLERPFAEGEIEGIRRMRAVLPRYMWRHTKVHVQDEIALPPSNTEWLELELPEVERLFYEREVKRHRDLMARRAGRGLRDPGDIKFLVTLRQLLSHPQVAQQLGYGAGGKRLTFDQLFSSLCAKSDAELNALRKDAVLATLQLIWGQDFYEEERNKRRWTGGPPVLRGEEVCIALRRALKICQDACAERRARGVGDPEEDEGDEEHVGAAGADGSADLGLEQAAKKTNRGDQAYRPRGRGKRKSAGLDDDEEGGGHTAFRWSEALYWVKMLLQKHRAKEGGQQHPEAGSAPGDAAATALEGAGIGQSRADQTLADEEVQEPRGPWDPLRPTRVFFEKAFKNATDKSVDLTDPRFHLIVQDAGSEDMDEGALEEVVAAHRRGLYGDEGDAQDGHDGGGDDAEAGPSSNGAASSAKRRKASPKNTRNDGDFEPVLKKSRLRGNAAQRQSARVWYYKPREKLSTTHTRLQGVLARQEAKEREVAFLHTRRDEVLGPQTATDADGGDGNGDGDGKKSGGADAATMAECGVCLEAMLCPGVLPCYHSFCLDCLQKLAADAPRCPNCRLRFTADDITEILRPVEKRRPSPGAGGEDDADAVYGDFGGKISGLIRDLRSRLRQDPTHKAVVFSHWKTMLSFIQTALLENGIGAVAFAGGSTSQSHALTSIRDDAETQVILVPFRASEGAAGLTLTCCDLAYMMEPAMDGALEAQAIGRINRIGQARTTTVIRVKMKDTIESAVIEVAEQKGRQGLAKLPGAAEAQVDASAADAASDDAAGDSAMASTSAAPSTPSKQGRSSARVAELRAQSIAASLSSTVGAAKSSSESSHHLTMEDMAKILGFDIEEEKRLEAERRAAVAEHRRQELERMGFLAQPQVVDRAEAERAAEEAAFEEPSLC
ncbi:related to SNF2 family helicase/ATPase [Pseudozyma flocculosa]|uniref:Related to SNF2 family helicase/ATPase n=1 Tax=Pseudozyma flocculosa TaxID=84751 RepID=A0A5C3EV34_9BASI|nr:related to SNF2 family helicase/ATPase [Pseudozyma flocculosa]